MKPTTLLVLLILMPASLLAQTPPATQTTPPPTPPAPAAPAVTTRPAAAPAITPTGGTKVAVLDVQRAIAENAEGKKAISDLNAAGMKKQDELAKRQKTIEDSQRQLQNGERVLSEAAKAELQRTIARETTALERETADAQQDMSEMQNKLIGPIAQLTQKVLNAYAAEMGFAVVFDSSSQASSIIHVDPVADITTEIIRRLDAEIAKTPKPPDPTKKQN